MGSLRCDHPDILEFIHAKDAFGQFTNFNLSVAVTDGLMRAVEADGEWQLVHERKPHAELLEDVTRNGGLGAFQRGDGMWVYETIRAKDMWDEIMRSTYDHAEPGVLFVDTANRENNLHYCERLDTCNPCAEEWLPDYGCCCLGSIDLTRFVREPFAGGATRLRNPYDAFDWDSFSRVVRVAVRMLDNVLDLTVWPLEKQREEAANKRRIGLGFLGLGDALVMLGVPYNSETGRSWAREIAGKLRNQAYIASCELAREKGAFPLLDVGHYMRSGFVDRLPENIRGLIQDHGIRNSHLLAVAPTGCTVAGTKVVTSEGIVRIEDFGDPDGETWQDVGVDVATDRGMRAAMKFFINGEADTYCVETARGPSICGTEDHKVRVITAQDGYAWVGLSDLKEGDVIVSVVDTYPDRAGNMESPTMVGGVERPPQYKNVGGRSHSIRNPQEYTPRIAELIGFIMANGSIRTAKSGSRVRLYWPANSHEMLHARFSETVREEFELEVRIEDDLRDQAKNLRSMTIGSKAFIEWLALNDALKDGAKGIKVPRWVFTSSREVIYAFIRGYFEGDGHVSVTGITASSICKEFLLDLQMLMQAVGIVSKLSISRLGGANGAMGSNDVWRLVVGSHLDKERFLDRVRVITDKNAAGIAAIREADRWAGHRTIATENRRLIGDLLETKTVPTSRESEVLLDEYMESLGVTQEYVLDRVSSVSYAGRAMTYDISVPDNVTYTAGGIVTHNTISLAFADNASNGIEPAFSWSYDRKKRMADGSKQTYVVKDHAYRAFEAVCAARGEEMPSPLGPEWVTALEMSATDHLKMMISVQPYIDTSISKTVNVPADCPFESFKDLYAEAWRHGLKGLATYRPNDVTGSVLSVTQAEAPKEAAQEAAEPDRRFRLDSVPDPVLNSLRWKHRPRPASGNPSWTFIVDHPTHGSFAIFVGHLQGEAFPFEVWVNGSSQPRGLGALAKSISMDMRTNDRKWLRAKLAELGRISDDTGFDMIMPPDGRMVWMPSMVAAFARVVQHRCEKLGTFSSVDTDPSPVLDALMCAEEPRVGPDGTMSWAVDVSNQATGDSLTMGLKELVLPDGTRRPYSVWLSGTYPRVLDGLAKSISMDMRVVDPGWVGAKLRQIEDFQEPRGDFLATVPGMGRRQANFPSTVAYIATLILHRYQKLGILTAAGEPVKPMGIMVTTDRRPEPAVREITPGRACPECGTAAVIRRDGCDFCTACGMVGSCG